MVILLILTAMLHVCHIALSRPNSHIKEVNLLGHIDQPNASAHPASSTTANADPFDTLEFLRNQAGSSTSNESKKFDSLLKELSHFYTLQDETGTDIVDALASIIYSGIRHYPNNQALYQAKTIMKTTPKLLKFEDTQS